jgi:hypothetical protein
MITVADIHRVLHTVRHDSDSWVFVAIMALVVIGGIIIGCCGRGK